MNQSAVVRAVALAVCAASVGTASAQTTETAPYDHIHLAAPDQAKAVAWYQEHFGGQATPEGVDRLMFGRTRVIFMKAESAQPSADSAIDHIGFSVADLDATMKELESAGAKVVAPARDVAGLFKLAFVQDPWGVKIEVVQDPETPGFHHIHLRGPDPDATLAWYRERFGGTSAKLKGRIDAVKYGDVWVLAQRGEATPSQGHAIDHLGWRVANLDAKLADLKAKGVKVTAEARSVPLPTGAIRVAFVEGPSATRIEIVQR